MDLRGNNFFLIFPREEGISIQTNPHYRLEKPPIPLADKPVRVPIREATILPAFFYSIQNEFGHFSKARFQYPIEPVFSLNHGSISLRPAEVKFPEESRIQIYENDITRSVDVPPKGGVFTLPNLLSVTKITLWQPEGEILLWETLPGISDEVRAVSVKEPVSLLTVKDFLDPEGGLEKLLEDIRRGLFHGKSVPPAEYSKLSQVLDILRAADLQSEREILTGLSREDPFFYQLITDKLIAPDLLPYMARAEVHKILSRIPETVWKTPIPMEKLKDYRRFLSRNRYEDLSRMASTEDAPDPIWPYIEKEFRERYARPLWVEVKKAEWFSVAEGKRSSTETGFDDRLFFASAGKIRLAGYAKQALMFYSELNLTSFFIYWETASGVFDSLRIDNFPPGYLLLRDFARLPAKIFFAGMGRDPDYRPTLVEGFAIRRISQE